jgi:hypothetical protein
MVLEIAFVHIRHVAGSAYLNSIFINFLSSAFGGVNGLSAILLTHDAQAASSQLYASGHVG